MNEKNRHLFIFKLQVQDKFVLHLNDEEAVQYMQNLIEISASAMVATLMENFHKMAQVRTIPRNHTSHSPKKSLQSISMDHSNAVLQDFQATV